MSYKITIEETRVEAVHIGKQWQLIGKQGEAIYGYAPETETNMSVTRQIYEQAVDLLDLVAVIATINGIQRANELR